MLCYIYIYMSCFYAKTIHQEMRRRFVKRNNSLLGAGTYCSAARLSCGQFTSDYIRISAGILKIIPILEIPTEYPRVSNSKPISFPTSFTTSTRRWLRRRHVGWLILLIRPIDDLGVLFELIGHLSSAAAAVLMMFCLISFGTRKILEHVYY